MLDWSHALLDPDEQIVFRRTGVFVGSFALPAAQQVLADHELDEWAALDHLGTLVDKSLLTVEAGEPPRYRLLESTRAYALEKLREASETEDVLRRHAQAMRTQFERVDEQFWTVTSQERKRRYLPDIDNVRAALDWARDAGEGELLIALTGVACWMFSAKSFRLEALRRCDEALACVDAATPPALEARLQMERFVSAWPAYDAQIRVAMARAIELYRRLDDPMALFAALSRFAVTKSWLTEIGDAELAVQQMAKLDDQTWPPALRSQLPKARYWLLTRSNRHEAGWAALDDMLGLAEAAGDDDLRLQALVYLEQKAMTQGKPEEAVTRGRNLVELTRHEKFTSFWAYTTINLGTALTELGRLDEALPLLRESTDLFRRRGLLTRCLDVLSLLALRQGRPADAARALGRADATNALRFGSEKRIRSLVETELRQALPDAELERLMADGAQLSDSDAVRYGFGK